MPEKLSNRCAGIPARIFRLEAEATRNAAPICPIRPLVHAPHSPHLPHLPHPPHLPYQPKHGTSPACGTGIVLMRADRRSLPEVHGSVPVPATGLWRKFLAFIGPGYLVAVGYMDPGNWATDLAGGARYGNALLSVIVVSNLLAMLLQALAARLGIATGRDLAQACREHYSPRASFALWIICEIAIAACDLAEVVGSAIALNLLFGLPLIWGVVITAADVFVLLALQRFGVRYVEALVVSLILIIGGCFAYELALARPDLVDVARSVVPRVEIVRDPGMLYIAVGILGATVMPHNLYLHSSIVQTRRFMPAMKDRAEAARFATLDSSIALMAALFINGAILVMSAAVFHGTAYQDVADIHDAHKLLAPLLGGQLAGVLFAVALLCSGQNATLTGTLAGQIVMEGFLRIRLRPWLRRLVTRLVAIVPAIVTVLLYGDRSVGPLLVLSQVILSLQLPFAVFPLVVFTSDPRRMGSLANPPWMKALAWSAAILIAALNVWLLLQLLADF